MTTTTFVLFIFYVLFFMTHIIHASGRILFSVVKESFNLSNIKFEKNSEDSVLVWSDTIKLNCFQNLKPWQTVNRLPYARTMCRKCPFIRLCYRAASLFPHLYDFLPKSFIFPIEEDDFYKEFERSKKMWIYKPDKGALGRGIKIIQKKDDLPHSKHLALLQEYIDSYVIEGKKFDLRIYVLILSINPLRIYVYRGGVARFCSENVDGNTKFSLLTNTAVNSKNPDAIPDSMTRMVNDVFNELGKMGHDINELWGKIDKAIVLSLISSYGFLSKEEEEQCPNYGFSRCFQIIGFDILLDRKLNPYILEINFRPSLKCNTNNSRNLKLKMLIDAIRIAGAPLKVIQELRETGELPTDSAELKNFMCMHKNIKKEMDSIRQANEINNGFQLVYPNSKNAVYQHVLEAVLKIPAISTLDYNLPIENKRIDIM